MTTDAAKSLEWARIQKETFNKWLEKLHNQFQEIEKIPSLTIESNELASTNSQNTHLANNATQLLFQSPQSGKTLKSQFSHEKPSNYIKKVSSKKANSKIKKPYR